MKLSSSAKLILMIAVVAVIGLLIGYAIGKAGGGAAKGKEEAKEAVTAEVKVVKAAEGTIEQSVAAYGSVIASPEDVQGLTVPFECRVRRVLVVAGQAVEAKTPLIDIEPSPEAALSLSDARTALQAAQRDFGLVQQRVEMKLATQSDLSTAQQTLRLAQSKLESLSSRGIEAKKLTAGLAGLVSKVEAEEGQVVAAGTALMDVVPAERVQVRLAVEPSAAGALKVGQKVHVHAVNEKDVPGADGAVRLITDRINPTSRLVDVYVTLPPGAPLKLETFVHANIVVATKMALIVPRQAVLPQESKQVLFTVEGKKAVRHEVETDLEDEKNVELLGEQVKVGDAVVVQGNAELKGDMAVEVLDGQSESQPAASEKHSGEEKSSGDEKSAGGEKPNADGKSTGGEAAPGGQGSAG